jgi:hypothetical protein
LLHYWTEHCLTVVTLPDRTLSYCCYITGQNTVLLLLHYWIEQSYCCYITGQNTVLLLLHYRTEHCLLSVSHLGHSHALQTTMRRYYCEAFNTVR